MSIIIGSARIDENGNTSGGKAGDQTGKEVSTQNFYVSPKGWNILRAKDEGIRKRLSTSMSKYCADDNVGYDQSNRTAILKYTGVGKTECDCSSLVRRCIIDSSGKDVGNFTTYNEKSVLLKSNLFEFIGTYNKDIELLEGDILVTCKKGHTVIVVSDNSNKYYPKCYEKITSIVDGLKSIGVDGSYSNRKKIAIANGIIDYSGLGSQNKEMLIKLKEGKLLRI